MIPDEEQEQEQEHAITTCIERYEGLTRQRAEEIIRHITTLRAGVIGDVCLDVYWEADMSRSTLSRETPHYTLPIVEERFSPGAAGNVAANLKELGCREVFVCSVTGQDWRGELLKSEFAQRQIDTSLLIASSSWHTPAYCKPIRVGLQQVRQEDPRLDFQNFQPMSSSMEAELIERLDQMMEQVDIVAVTDQLPNGVIGQEIRNRLAVWADRGKKIVVDSRNNIGAYQGVIVKPNEVEASRWFDPIAEVREQSSQHWAETALRLSNAVNGVCCMTLGSEGALWAEREHCIFVPTRAVEPPIDIVGAGDAFASALLSALGAGSTGPEAMAFAHIASSIVIRKIGTTGTASPQEMIQQLSSS
ncbi:bifunctional heptose 7-phosphate kinase/heptose 1-phosphate adenyltransferase [Paenibacillus sp. UNC451MF]|uniref:bifunctional heptose 7-phosphate kinase/heptose 1-phosphate adenyltransferase n=1 Tax=Paenibacillus sp. UNC451MF TaxID=1449063 RepID=UPI00068D0870|nr:PfkB family carbohydrate kinase [Paenibacillus sp. UNC451MF]